METTKTGESKIKKKNGYVFKKSAWETIRNGVLPMLFTFGVIAIVMIGLMQAEASCRAEGISMLEKSVKNAVVQCYAVEGNYPGSLSYIEERYGVYVDRSRYSVFYVVFAPNIMPSITVVELGGD
ncbi:MAG: hypothetical protein FWH55_02970 [Oscillospiraceae bacterium]|nr:hypothetical protein [Oscillospiraceae bacterium]